MEYRSIFTILTDVLTILKKVRVKDNKILNWSVIRITDCTNNITPTELLSNVLLKYHICELIYSEQNDNKIELLFLVGNYV